MFDDAKDRIARLSVARLQKRIDELKAHQEMLDKFTMQRTLSELEHYRLQLSIGVASFVFFTALILIGLGLGVFAKIAGYYDLVAGLLALNGVCGSGGHLARPTASRPSGIGRPLARLIVQHCNKGSPILKNC
jgi:hypothetical protein